MPWLWGCRKAVIVCAATLEGVLRLQEGQMVFQEFLKTEFSVENILFWKEIELLRLELSSGTMDQTSKNSRAEDIYATYILQGGSYQVNLPAEIVRRLQVDITREVDVIHDMYTRRIQGLI